MKTKTNGPNRPLTESTLGGASPNGSKTVRQLGERASNGGGPMFGPIEPVIWVRTDDRTPHGNNTRRVNGKLERLPSIAHTGESDYLDRKVHSRAHSRYRSMLDASGNVCSIVHSNSAAHLPVIAEGKWSADGYASHVLRKGYALGWIDVNAGCLLRQVAAGVVNQARMLVDTKGSKVCAKDATTCKHIAAEQAERQARNAAVEERRQAAATATDPSIAIGIAVAKALAAHDVQKGK